MLTVRTEVHSSPIAGLGLFAAEPIAAGQVWWKFDRRLDRTYTPVEFEELPAHIQDWLKTYAYLQGGLWVLCGDHAKFVNHSDHPNSVTVGDESIALRDIAAGEEIVENYREFCEDWPLIPFLNADGPGKTASPSASSAA
jgi:SET domain-containing protein